MALSKPNNALFVSDLVRSGDESSGMLDSNENATRINQIHGIASNNALGAGIPKQVTDVQVSVANAQQGTTCTVTLLFRIDSTDTNFAGVKIWVSRYQGNNQLVQVASGTSSPSKFVLNNTGERVSFTIQAYGNGGTAPITQSPTASATLPPSTAGGFGSSTSTSTLPALTMPAEFSVAGSGTATITVSKATENKNTVWAGPISGSAAQPAFRSIVTEDLPWYPPAFWSSGGVVNNTQTVGFTPGFSSTATLIAPTATEPQYNQFTTGAGAGSNTRMIDNATSSSFTRGIWHDFRCRVSLPSTANVRVWICMTDTVALNADSPAFNVIGFRYSTAAGDTTWKCCVSVAAGTTVVDSGVAISTGSFKLRILKNASGDFGFWINDVLVTTILASDTHMPAAATAIKFAGWVDNVSLGNAKSLNIAYVYWDASA